jgi:hypothetical protein
MPDHITALIAHIDTNMPIDGPYKVAVLKTVAAYYESVTHAESMSTLIMNAFRQMQ